MALWSLAARAGIPAARSALNFLSKLKKPAGEGITRVWRGVEPAHKGFSMAGTAYPKGLKGRFFTTRLYFFGLFFFFYYVFYKVWNNCVYIALSTIWNNLYKYISRFYV